MSHVFGEIYTILQIIPRISKLPIETLIHPCVLIPSIALDASWGKGGRGKCTLPWTVIFRSSALASVGWTRGFDSAR